jgi:hypothetical protein
MSQPFKLPGSGEGVRAYDMAFLVNAADSLATMRNTAIGYGYDTLAVMLEYAAREADRIHLGRGLDGNPV